MNIDIKTNVDFARHLKYLEEKYGEDLQRLNGFHPSQLNFSDFIDAFVSKNSKNADITIDANANASTKDVCSLRAERGKAEDKLFAFNKIFYELKKKYGLKCAKDWLESEYVGSFYIHDASSTTFLPYCITPTECCSFIINGKHYYMSMMDVYEFVDDKEVYDEINNVFYKKPTNTLVLDYDKKTGENRYTKVEMISKKTTDKSYFFTKCFNGANIITTEDHKFICENEDVEANKLIENESNIYSTYDKNMFTNSMYEYNGLELNADFGYLLGIYLAEGYEQGGQLSICQSEEKSPNEWNRILGILDKYSIPYKFYKNNNIIRLKNGDFNWERKLHKLFKGRYCYEKRLSPDFIHFNDTFLKSFLAGIIDGDGTVAKNKQLSIRMTSRTLINQIREIGLHFGVFFGSRLPYIQSQEAKIQQKRPMHSACVNMNRDKEFFMSLGSNKINSLFTDYNYDEKFANKNYVCEFGHLKVRDCEKTYKYDNVVYDLSTESHTFVCNDILVHNCYAYDLSRLAREGLFFIPKPYHNEAPKHATTFMDDVIEFISFFSNRSSGAVGLPNIFIWAWWFWKVDCDNGYFIKDKEYFAKQLIQKFIYRINQPFLRVNQSAFINVTFFDRNYLESLFGTMEYPDGKLFIDYIEEVMDFQKIVMGVISDIRSKNLFTFPVITYSLLKYPDNDNDILFGDVDGNKLEEECLNEMLKDGL